MANDIGISPLSGGSVLGNTIRSSTRFGLLFIEAAGYAQNVLDDNNAGGAQVFGGTQMGGKKPRRDCIHLSSIACSNQRATRIAHTTEHFGEGRADECWCPRLLGASLPALETYKLFTPMGHGQTARMCGLDIAYSSVLLIT